MASIQTAEIERLQAEIARMRSKGERMAEACKVFRAKHDADARRCNFDSCGCDACVSVKPALAEWEGTCGTCGGSEIAKFGNGPAFDTPCPDCTKGGERG